MPQAVLDLAAGRGFVIEWDALREASRVVFTLVT